MSIDIIIEDGSGVADANSYATIEQARNYARVRGVTLAPETPEGNDTVASYLIAAMDYLASLDYVGSPVDGYQPLSFPREDMHINPKDPDDVFPADKIPPRLIEAQCRLVMDLHEGVNLMPNMIPGQFVVKEKVGPIETQFSETVGIGDAPELTAVMAILGNLLNDDFGGGMVLHSVRV